MSCSPGFFTSGVGDAVGDLERPEVLVLDVDQVLRPGERLRVRAGDGALAVRGERERRPLRGVGAQQLHRVRAGRSGAGAASGSGFGCLGMCARRCMSIRSGVRRSSGCGSFQRSANTSSRSVTTGPRSSRAASCHGGRAPYRSSIVSACGSPRVLGVVSPAVGQVEAPDERDIPVRVVAPTDDEQLLVVRTEQGHPLVEQHLAARFVDLPAEERVGAAADRAGDLLAVRPPDQPAHLHAAAREAREELADRRALGQEALVGVAPPVGEPDPVPGLEVGQLGVESREVLGAVDQRGGRGCPPTTWRSRRPRPSRSWGSPAPPASGTTTPTGCCS